MRNAVISALIITSLFAALKTARTYVPILSYVSGDIENVQNTSKIML